MTRTTIGILGLTVALAGCGSSGDKGSLDGGSGTGGSAGAAGHPGAGAGGAGGGACTAAVPLGGVSPGTMSWVDNGVAQCAYVIETTRISNASADSIDIIGTSPDLHTIDLAVTVPNGTLGGPYACSSNPLAEPSVLLEIESPTAAGFSQDCSITIEQAGTATEHARGTFSGSASSDGGVNTVTSGVFDVVVTPQGG
jgi:hypothetical protein